jgi:hypothetical protein
MKIKWKVMKAKFVIAEVHYEMEAKMYRFLKSVSPFGSTHMPTLL